MNAEWIIWRGAFSPEECKNIVDRGANLPEIMANQGPNGENPDRSYRRSKIKWMYETLYDDVFDKMWKLTTKVNEEFFGFHINSLRFMQLTEYNAEDQGEYKKHHDVFYMNQTKHRKLSVVLQLTDRSKYQGGELVLETQDQQPQDYFEQGTVIWFPSFTPHWVNPVTSGKRNSVVCWFEGPHWQ